jgi:hypothetical protein
MSADGVANEDESGREKPDPPSIAPKPWYKDKNTWIIGLPLLVFWFMFYRPIDVTRGPWQVLDPGLPVEPLKFEVVREGNGEVVEVGGSDSDNFVLSLL